LSTGQTTLSIELHANFDYQFYWNSEVRIASPMAR